MLGLEDEKLERNAAANEAVIASESDDEAPEAITKQSAKEHIKRLDLEAANASKRYCDIELTSISRKNIDFRLGKQLQKRLGGAREMLA